MTSRSRRFNGRQGAKDWFEKNPSKTQFYLTLIVLVSTVLFSYLSLRETRKQYDIAKGSLDNASGQLRIAKEQYQSQLIQKKEDLRLDSLRDIALAQKEEAESIRNINNDAQQRKYNQFQSQINSQQLKINKQQLSAIQIQAKVADDQFKFQKIQSANQFEDNRPIYGIDSVHLNKSKSSYTPTISFFVSNHGSRNPHVDSTVIASWNSNYKCSKVEKHLTNIDFKDVSFITGLAVYQDCIDDPNTIYYLNIIYKDTYDNEVKTKRRFFRYVKKPSNSIVTVDVGDDEAVEFIKYLKINEKRLGRLL